MIPYVEPGTHLFRFMDHRTNHFWPAIIDMLTEQKLFLNSRTKFNDPYDSQPIIDDDLSSSALRSYLEDMMQNPLNPKRDPSDIAQILHLKALGKTHLNKRQLGNIKASNHRNAIEFLDTCGLLSFSLAADNPLLWGHYAAAFAGVCVVFKRNTSTQSALSVCARVLYVGKRPHLPLSLLHQMAQDRIAGNSIDAIANQIFFFSFLHKSDHWSYEQEARIFYPYSALSKIKFEPNELVAIILGPKSLPDLEKRLRDEIRQRQTNVEVHKASLSQIDFRIVIPHNLIQSRTVAA